MIAQRDLIELLMADELDLEAVRANAFFQKVQQALVVELGERGLALCLRDEILYSMLVFRRDYFAGKEIMPALEDLIRKEARIVGATDVDRVFNEFRRAVTNTFVDLEHVEGAIRRIEGVDQSPKLVKEVRKKKGRQKCCAA